MKQCKQQNSTNMTQIMNRNRREHLSLIVLLAGLGAGAALAQTTVPATNPPPHWVSSAAVGVTLTRGNSDTTTLSLSANTEKKWTSDDLSLGADALYGNQKTDGANKTTETADLLHGFIQYNRSFTERFYVYGRVDGLHDGLADIQYRLALSPGLGYYFIKEKATDLSLEAGPTWVDEKLGDSDLSFGAYRVAEKFHQTLSDRARVWESLEYLDEIDKLGNYIENLEVGMEADLNKKKNLSLRVTFDDTYNNEPAAGRLKNDLKLITAIAYKF
jgi:putative salt-induced outer membrane protein YdiY